VVSRYKKLLSGEMTWSSTVRDYQKEMEKGRVCVYCGATESLSTDHIIPISRVGVDPRVMRILDSPDNCVCACRQCNASKSDRDVFEWYGPERIDEIPKLVLSKFLKLTYGLHETQGRLDLKDPNMDGVLDIYDLGVVITHLISRLSAQSGQEGQLRSLPVRPRCSVASHGGPLARPLPLLKPTPASVRGLLGD
jgi:hypothetical protein